MAKPLKRIDAVAWDTPASRATSRLVANPCFTEVIGAAEAIAEGAGYYRYSWWYASPAVHPHNLGR